MPVEIRELVIRAEVISREKQATSEGSGSLSPKERSLLIEECVDQVMRAMKRQKER